VQLQHFLDEFHHLVVRRFVGLVGRINQTDRHFLHVLVNESVAVFARADPEWDAYVADRKPKQPTVQDAQQVAVFSSETVGGVGEIMIIAVETEAWPLRDVGEN
jgi:hypothetical protein